jgi:hypothetical protein
MKQKKLDTLKSSGFKTPKDYFSQVEEHILNEVRLQDQVDDSGFEVPNDYFDSVDNGILSKLKEDKPVITLKSRQGFYYIAGIAASLLLLFAIYINQESSDDISAEMVENYFQDSDLDSYELAQLLSDAELLEDDFIISETDYSEDNIEAYLLDNSDIEELLQ